MDINTVNLISKLNYEPRAIRGAMALFSGENVAIRVSCVQMASAETSIMEQLEML